MSSALTQDNISKIEMLIVYRKDVERFLRERIVESLIQGYGNEVLVMQEGQKFFTQATLMLEQKVAELSQIQKDGLQEMQLLVDRLQNYKKGIFGKTKKEIIQKGYFNEAEKSKLYTSIEDINRLVQELLVAIQDDKEVYGHDEYSLMFIEIPEDEATLEEAHANIMHLGDVLASLTSYFELRKRTFQDMADMVFFNSFSDFGINGKTFTKFIENTQTSLREHYTVREFVEKFKAYLEEVLISIPENLAETLSEYYELQQEVASHV